MAFFRLRIRKLKTTILLLLCFLPALMIWINHDNDKYLAGIAEVEGWYRNTSRDANVYILPHNKTVRILPEDFCKKDTDVLIIVCSHISNGGRRAAIRESWGSSKNIAMFALNIYFLLGESPDALAQKKIEDESTKYGDIIQERFIDSYYNLTIKSLMMLKIVNLHCTTKIKFVMKVDDDVYVNVGFLIGVLENEKSENLLLGRKFHHANVVRDLKSKWNIPYYLYEGDYYPDYVAGTGYVMSINLVPQLYAASLKTAIFHLEDVYITGILAQKILVNPKHSQYFHISKLRFPCTMSEQITGHSYRETQLRFLFKLTQKYDIRKRCRLVLLPRRGKPKEFYTLCTCRML